MSVRETFWADSMLKNKGEFSGIENKILPQTGGNLGPTRLVLNCCIDNEFILLVHKKTSTETG